MRLVEHKAIAIALLLKVSYIINCSSKVFVGQHPLENSPPNTYLATMLTCHRRDFLSFLGVDSALPLRMSRCV